MPKFRTAVLARFEERNTTAIITTVEQAAGDRPARERLHRLLEEVLRNGREGEGEGEGAGDLETAVL